MIYACFAAGVPVAPMSSTSSALEARHLSQLGQCAIIFVHPKCLATIQKAGYPKEQVVLIEPAKIDWHGPTLDDCVKIGKASAVIVSGGIHPVPAHRVGLILFSSGSTGNPKGIQVVEFKCFSSINVQLI